MSATTTPSNVFQAGDLVTILDPVRGRIPGTVERYNARTDEYAVRTRSGALWTCWPVWLVPRKVRTPKTAATRYPTAAELAAHQDDRNSNPGVPSFRVGR